MSLEKMTKKELIAKIKKLESEISHYVCRDCDGEGLIMSQCSECGGTGGCPECGTGDCSSCYGDGYLEENCSACDGTGRSQ